MKRIILLELCFLFLATTFQSDRMTGWVQQTIPRPDLAVKDLQFLDSLNGFAILLHATPDTAFVIKTIDGGLNWSITKFENTYVTAISFTDINTGYISARQSPNGVILKTTNSGENWFTVSNIPNASILRDIFFINNDTGWVCSRDLTAGGLWRTTNGGQSWQLQLDYNYTPTKIFFINSSTGWVIGNSGVNLYKTTNSGLNWNLQFHYSNPTNDVYFINKDTGYVTGGSGNGLMRSTDGGNNWNVCNNLPIYPGARVFFINNNRGWVGNGFNKILVTTDGFNWGYQYSPSYSSYNVSFVDTLIGWAGYSGLVHTTDGGGPIVNINQTGTEVPKDFVLEQNYPNPFNQSSIINYQLSKAGIISIKIYDISGKEISTLINEQKNAGKYSVTFAGSKLTSGIYFYVLIADDKIIDTKKAILIK